MLYCVSIEERIPTRHPLRRIRKLAVEVLSMCQWSKHQLLSNEAVVALDSFVFTMCATRAKVVAVLLAEAHG